MISNVYHIFSVFYIIFSKVKVEVFSLYIYFSFELKEKVHGVFEIWETKNIIFENFYTPKMGLKPKYKKWAIQNLKH